MGKKGIKTGSVKAAEKQRKKAWRTKKPPWEQKNLSRADKVVRFCNVLPVTAGVHAGRRLKLRPWQEEIVRAIYTEKGGKRVVRQALITMPRKQGKSTLASALALCHLIGPECEERGQIFSCAADREQASIIFREMEAIVLRIPEFAERVNIRAFTKEIIDEESGSVYRALSSDGRKGLGLSPSFVIYDELCAAKNRELYDNISSGTGARKEPLMVVISTQSADPHHVLSELVDYALSIEEGSLPPDPSFYGAVFAAADDCDPWDEKVWFDCNPALDDFRSLDEMREFAKKAQKMPQMEGVFKNLYLNMRIETADKFITTDAFNGCVGTIPDDLIGRKVFLGLDLAAVRDLTAAVICSVPEPGEPYYIIPFAWCPSESITQRTKEDRLPYSTWRNQGFIEPIKGGVIDYAPIIEKIAWIKQNFDLQGVVYDPWGSQKIVNDLKEMDIEVLEMRQGYASMAPPIRELEKLILEKGIVFPDNDLLRWNFSNLVVEQDAAGNRKFSKGKAVEKIDLCVALVMALDAAIRNRVEVVQAAIGWL
jgi:phage terminase large subunit-like protein